MDFAGRIAVGGPLHCHIWTGATSPRGYPVARINGKVRQVRRVVYERDKRKLRPNERVEMQCDERLCVYPAHMIAVERYPSTRPS